MTREEEIYFKSAYSSAKSYAKHRTQEPFDFTMRDWLIWWDNASPEVRDQRIARPRSVIPIRPDPKKPWSPSNMDVKIFPPGFGPRKGLVGARRPRVSRQLERPLIERTEMRSLSISEWIAELKGVRV